MKNKYILLTPIFALSLSACSLTGVQHDISEYVLSTNYKDNYRILQLTDIHLSDKDNQDLHFKFMDLTIADAHPDMIIVTGDLFTLASQSTAKRLFSYLDSKNVPWTVTFGNHDEQCFFSIDWLTGYLNGLTESGTSKCLFKDIQDDGVHGNANFAINLMQGNEIFEQLIIMDSNRYNYGGYFGYDYFKDDQIKWYEDLVDYTTTKNGHLTESLMFYHIPLPEINDAWDKANDNSGGATLEYGEKREKTCPPDENSGFFDKIVAKGSTKAMFFGHDHINDFRVKYNGVVFSYGIKATDRIYYDDDMTGGQVIILKNDHTLSYEQIRHTYKEVK